jgi:hypothetical protein
MSSFVVNKSEFVKAAGLMYGMESAKRHKHIYFMENVRKDFEKAYLMNVDSVNEQYGDDMQPDSASYDTYFDKYSKIGKSIYAYYMLGEPHKFNELRPQLMTFFSSVLYQIENEEMSKEVSSIFYRCIRKLYDKELEGVEGWWGTIEI